MTKPIHIISDGGGVQSSFLKDIASKDAFEVRPTVAIFADTMWEPESVYRWMEIQRLSSKIPMVSVSAGNLGDASLKTGVSKKTGKPYIKGLIPAFVANQDGTKGILGRSCTFDFKISPVRKEMKSILGDVLSKWKKDHKKDLKVLSEWERAVRIAKRNKTFSPLRPSKEWNNCQEDAAVVQWLGISYDEAGRAKESNIPWIKNRHPLLEIKASRSHCQKGVPGAPRTACKFCPFHNDDEWRRLKQDEPDEFEAAVRFESSLQSAANGNIDGIPFLHGSLKPLGVADFSLPSHVQGDLFNNECEGMCGV